MSREFSLDRETNIRENIDATGKKWEVHVEKGRHLFYALPAGARADAVIPDKLQGMFTKKMLIDSRIREWVKESWNHADEVAAKNARKAQAAKEAKKKDAGSTKD